MELDTAAARTVVEREGGDEVEDEVEVEVEVEVGVGDEVEVEVEFEDEDEVGDEVRGVGRKLQAPH
jgi:hypothetical protein